MIKRPEIRERILATVCNALFLHARVAGHPDDTARDSGGAAEFGALLNNSYVCAAIVGSDSRAQACSASSNNENVCRL